MSMIEQLESRRLLSVAPHLFAHGTPVHAIQFASTGTVTVAGFREKVPSTYTATIDWGDDSTTPGATVISDGKGGFLVQGSHTYANAGLERVKIQITGLDGSSATVFAPCRVVHPPITATGQNINGVQTLKLTGVVATYVDPDPDATAGPPVGEIATIFWGDGTASRGTIALTSPNNFSVTGSHAYAGARTFAVTTIVRARGGAVAKAASLATIAVPVATTTPDLTSADFVGTVSVAGSGLIPTLLNTFGEGSFDFEVVFSNEQIGQITAKITIDGKSATESGTGNLLTNGNFYYQLSFGSGLTGTLSGHVAQKPTGLVIAGSITGTFAVFSIKGNYVATDVNA
jgi:hypothetical protein